MRASSPELLRREMEAAWPAAERSHHTQLVAVSGGADSVALLRLLHAGPRCGPLVVAHFDHGLRSQSSEDYQFVASLAAELGLAFRGGTADSVAGTGEAAARHARYRFLRGVAEEIGARYVVTAHTADDQAETILHRILRGTGPRGLRGMRPFRAMGPAVTLVRPLLAVRRIALREYLESIGQSFRTDATNWDPRYTRNRLRHDLLPQLEQAFNARVVESLRRLGILIGEMYDEWHAGLTTEFEGSIRVAAPDEIVVVRRGLDRLSMLAVTELLTAAWREAGWPEQSMGFEDWRRLARMATTGHPSRLVFPGEIVAENQGGSLTMRRVQLA